VFLGGERDVDEDSHARKDGRERVEREMELYFSMKEDASHHSIEGFHQCRFFIPKRQCFIKL